MITSSLKVFLWDEEIGRLSWDSRRGNSYFEYNHNFLTKALNPFPSEQDFRSYAGYVCRLSIGQLR